MTVIEFYDLLKDKQETLRTEADLWKHASHEDEAGNRRLLTFLLSRRDLPVLLEKVAKASPVLQGASPRCRMAVLREAAAANQCSCPTPSRWRHAADEVVALNGFRDQELQRTMLEALMLGRGKKRTIFIIGNTNRAKSFVFKPLQLLYAVFRPPESGSHQLADIEGSEAVWLNDFQYEAGCFLQWNKLKDFLEGESIKVAVPKHQGRNYMFTLDAPVFGTAPCPVRHPSKQAETDQMNSRIQYFVFTHYFDPSTCPDIKPCRCCCAQWLLEAAHRPTCPPQILPPHLAKTPTQMIARHGWLVGKSPGSYSYEDLPGQCFRCGARDHFVADCPLNSA